MNKRDIFFSIVIPAYNAANFIEKALDSIRCQTFTNYEVIVVNDGSTDETEYKLLAYKNEFKQFPLTIVTQLNKGIGGARNSGIFCSTGKYIAFLDSDDYWYKEKLDKVFHFLESHRDIDIVCHYETAIGQDGSEKLLKYGSIDNTNAYEDLLYNGNKLSPSATIVRKDLAKAIGGLSEDPKFNSAEDYEFWLRLAKERARFALIPQVLGVYVLEANSITSKIKYHHDNIQNVLDHHFGIIRESSSFQPRINKIYKLRKAGTIFAAGRSYYLAGDYEASIISYYKAIRLNPCRWKPYAGIIQAVTKYVLKCVLK